jgi:hypothetical protein
MKGSPAVFIPEKTRYGEYGEKALKQENGSGDVAQEIKPCRQASYFFGNQRNEKMKDGRRKIENEYKIYPVKYQPRIAVVS